MALFGDERSAVAAPPLLMLHGMIAAHAVLCDIYSWQPVETVQAPSHGAIPKSQRFSASSYAFYSLYRLDRIFRRKSLSHEPHTARTIAKDIHSARPPMFPVITCETTVWALAPY